MVNKLQRFLCMLGVITPYMIIGGCIFTWKIYKRNDLQDDYKKIFLILGIVGIAVSISLLVYHIVFLYYSIKVLPDLEIEYRGIPEENDSVGIILCSEIAIPIVKWLYETNQGGILTVPWVLIIGLIFFFIELYSNKAFGSPVYWMLGYHFHSVQTTGGKKVLLISKKRHYRNGIGKRRVKRIFDNIMLEIKEKENV